MGLDLYWIPLGAGDRPGQKVVRFFGRVFETFAAIAGRRPRCDLFHAALIASYENETVSIEVAPVPDDEGSEARGVVATGAVGMRPLGRFRLFRYEVRRWTDGTIPDLRYAVQSPVRITENIQLVRGVLDRLRDVPTPVWGRDELHAGEMWNSNSVIAWVLATYELDGAAGVPPNNGRAPGWSSGVVTARQFRESKYRVNGQQVAGKRMA